MRFVRRFAIATALCCTASALRAQGSLGLQGWGYPGGGATLWTAMTMAYLAGDHIARQVVPQPSAAPPS